MSPYSACRDCFGHVLERSSRRAKLTYMYIYIFFDAINMCSFGRQKSHAVRTSSKPSGVEHIVQGKVIHGFLILLRGAHVLIRLPQMVYIHTQIAPVQMFFFLACRQPASAISAPLFVHRTLRLPVGFQCIVQTIFVAA